MKFIFHNSTDWVSPVLVHSEALVVTLSSWFFDEAMDGLQAETTGWVENFRLGHINPGSGQSGRFWEFSSVEMDSEPVSQTCVGSLWKEDTERCF